LSSNHPTARETKCTNCDRATPKRVIESSGQSQWHHIIDHVFSHSLDPKRTSTVQVPMPSASSIFVTALRYLLTPRPLTPLIVKLGLARWKTLGVRITRDGVGVGEGPKPPHRSGSHPIAAVLRHTDATWEWKLPKSEGLRTSIFSVVQASADTPVAHRLTVPSLQFWLRSIGQFPALRDVASGTRETNGLQTNTNHSTQHGRNTGFIICSRMTGPPSCCSKASVRV
jgi:hypothetical protein